MTNEEIIKGLQATNEHIGKHFNEGGAWMAEFIDNAIKALEQQRWIPVSERLPKVGEKVLCQCQANIFEVLKLTVDGWYHDDNHCYMLGFVIAWQPLPQPYAESEEWE